MTTPLAPTAPATHSRHRTAGATVAPLPPAAPSRSRSRAAAAPPARPVPAAHAALLAAFGEHLATADPTGLLVARSDDVAGLARDAARRVLDTAATWSEHLGAFYDTAGVARLLAHGDAPISRQAVHKRRGLLALTTGSGQVVYPAFQFDGPRPLPGLAAVLDVLSATAVSPWTVASWLVSPEPELGGDRPADVLREQGPEGALAVLGAARRWAAQLDG